MAKSSTIKKSAAPPNAYTLLKDLHDPSKEKSSTALRTLITNGLAKQVLSEPGIVVRDSVYLTAEVEALIDELGPSHPKVYAGLAEAIIAPGRSVRRAALLICSFIKSPPSIVLKAIVSALLYDWRDDIRWEAAHVLGVIRSSNPVVLKGLATALQEYDLSVLFEVMLAIHYIRVPSPEILASLCQLVLYRPNSTFCEMALSSIEQLATFDPTVIAALQYLANSSFSFSVPDYAGVENDADYWSEQRDDANTQYKSNRDKAARLLTTISPDAIKPYVRNIHIPQHPIQDEADEHAIGLFKDLNLDEYLTGFQVYWFIGCIDREAMKTAGTALGFGSLVKLREKFKPSFKNKELTWNAEYLSDTLFPKKLGPLIAREPFSSHCWPGMEKDMDLSEIIFHGKKQFRRWTPKAWQLWLQIDRYLTTKDLKPQIDADLD